MTINLKTLIIACVLMAASMTALAGLEDGKAAFTKKNYALALKELTPLAKSGDAEAETYLGFMHANGQGVAQDYKEAMKWYKLAAKQGNAAAQFTMGSMYTEGQGGEQDHKQAVRWYLLAAGHGDAFAQFNLGLSYANGQGIARDYKEAVKWFRRAASQGDADAQNSLGVMYANGHGVTASEAVAYALYNLSATIDQSSENMATSNRAALIAELPPRILDAAQTLTREMAKPGNMLKALDAYLKNPH